MKKNLLFVAVMAITFVNAQAILVKDIETGSLSSMPDYELNRIDFNGKLIFSALDNGTNSYKVWTTDGTESGTALIGSTNGNTTNNAPKHFTYLSAVNKVFFRGSSGNSSPRLWSTDGTQANTLFDNSIEIPNYITELNNKLYFQGQVASSGLGFELVNTDGTNNNSSIIDLNIGGNSSPRELKTIGNKLYFSATAYNLEGREPCVSDGTTSGTYRIKNIKPGLSGSDPLNFTSFNSKVYFSADNGTNGRELWVTDGTEVNTMMVADLNPGVSPSLDPAEPTIFTEYKDELYFAAFTSATGNELFKVNTSGNIVNVADINPGANNHSNPKDFYVFEGKLYFSADDGTNGVELWVVNNTGSSTAKSSSKLTTTITLLKDISVGSTSSKPNQFIAFQDKLYFNANDGVNDKELWETDGTVVGTKMVQNINPSGDSNPRDFIVSNNLLYFSADDGTNGDELWKFSNDFIIGNLSPEDNGTGFALSGQSLKITLNKEVIVGTGNIVIHKSSDDSVFLTVNVRSSGVSINNNIVTITSPLSFSLLEDYYVLIDNNALKDTSNNFFPGIMDKTTWNFQTIGAQNQTITFNALPNKIYGDADFQLTATASSNYPVSYTSSDTNVASINGSMVTIVGAGTATITASQSGDANYNAATDVTQILTVDKASQSIIFNALTNKTFGDADFNLTATASSNLTVSYVSSNPSVASVTGNVVSINAIGVTTFTASQLGDNNYNTATAVSQTLTVSTGLSTDDFNKLSFNIYPNPAETAFRIDTEKIITNMSIFNIHGQLVKIFENLQEHYNIEDLTTGIYFVNIKTNEGEITKKIIKE